MKTTAATRRNLRSKKFTGVSVITLPFSRSRPSVKSPNFCFMDGLESLGSLTSKNKLTTRGIAVHRIKNVIVSTELITSHLESNVIFLAFMKAHIQIIEKDSFIRVICCDQNRERFSLFLILLILRLNLDIGCSTNKIQLSSGIIARPITIEPILVRKKVDWNPRTSN